MLIEVGPRSIGKCDLKYSTCKGKNISIVKKVFLAKSGDCAWACQSCIIDKLKKDRIETIESPVPALRNTV